MILPANNVFFLQHEIENPDCNFDVQTEIAWSKLQPLLTSCRPEATIF
jgi:hypothetical protein